MAAAFDSYSCMAWLRQLMGFSPKLDGMVEIKPRTLCDQISFDLVKQCQMTTIISFLDVVRTLSTNLLGRTLQLAG